MITILLTILVIAILILDIGIFLMLKALKSRQINKDTELISKNQQNIVLLAKCIKDQESRLKKLESRQAADNYKLTNLSKAMKPM